MDLSNALALGGGALAVLAGVLLHAASPNAGGAAGRRLGRGGTWMGLALAAASLVAWSASLGFGAGLCAWFGTLVTVLVALPFLALRGRLLPAAPTTPSTGRPRR